MIKYRDQILHGDTPVFTKIGMETPLTEDLELPSDACFLYIEEGDGQPLALNIKVSATKGTVILSTCGMTIGHMISEKLQGLMETIIVHFNRELLNACFEGEKPKLWEELQRPVNEYVVQRAASELVQGYFAGINQLFNHKEAVTPSMLELKLKEIILLLLQTDNSDSVRQIIKSLFSARTFSFKELVDAHLYTPATIENLAQLTGTSASTFKRKFKVIYDASPGQYVLEKRLEKVAEQIRITDEPISQIGYQLGFESPEHLSRAFKKHFGVTPSTYRMSRLVKS